MWGALNNATGEDVHFRHLAHPHILIIQGFPLMPKKPNKIDRAKRIPIYTSFGDRARAWTLRHCDLVRDNKGPVSEPLRLDKE
jgi:hypothetical protein